MVGEADAPVHAVEATGITVAYGGVMALAEVSIRADKGAIVGLMGPNGAGKTTMVGVLSGFVRPTGGEVRICGQVLTRRGPRAFARAGVRRTFQRAAVIEDLSVREHMLIGDLATDYDHRLWLDGLLPARWRGQTSWERAEAKAEGVLDRLGLSWCAQRRPGSLPPATQRVVELGMALMADPAVLLLDEPTAGLNRSETDAIGAVLRDIAAEGTVATILIEHDVSLMMSVADHVYVLDFGKLIADGIPEAIRQHPDVQTAYLGARG